MMKTTSGLFVTGTNTGVGKTAVVCHIARSLQAAGTRVGVYKPVCSGAQADESGRPQWSDVRQLAAATSDSFPDEWICPQRFAAPLAPPSAAILEGRTVDADLMRSGAARWDGEVDLLLVEGVGGLLCPLTAEETVADLAADLGFPLLIVSNLELGTINHTLLSVEVAESRGLAVAGIVMNSATGNTDSDVAAASISEIASRCPVPILGPISHQSLGRNGEYLESGIDWMQFIGRVIAGEI